LGAKKTQETQNQILTRTNKRANLFFRAGEKRWLSARQHNQQTGHATRAASLSRIFTCPPRPQGVTLRVSFLIALHPWAFCLFAQGINPKVVLPGGLCD
jgi:hypothetical protein